MAVKKTPLEAGKGEPKAPRPAAAPRGLAGRGRAHAGLAGALPPRRARQVRLGDVCAIIQGQSPDSAACSGEPGSGLLFFQGKAEFGRLRPTPNRWCSEPAKVAEKNDVLISVRAPVGDVNICSERCCIGRGIMAIRAQEGVDFLYLFYYLRHIQSKISRLGSGTTFSSITGKHLKEIKISVPSPESQRRIASILSNVDAMIENVENSVVVYKRIMSGLLHDLANLKHKSTNTQEIFLLCNMQKMRLRDICEIIQGQSPDSAACSSDPKSGLPFFQGKAEFGRTYPTPNRWCSKPVKIAIKNDILISVRAPVGDVNICSTQCCIGRGIMAIRSYDSVDFLYVFYYLRAIQDKICRLGSGTTFMSITGKQLKELEIVIPSLKSQKQIASILSGVDAQPTRPTGELIFL